MQPTSYPIRRELLKQFWYSYMKKGRVAAISGVEPDPVVVRSWQRCVPRSDPRQRPRMVTMQANTLRATQKTHADVMMLARPFLEDIYQFLEGAYCTIVFTDGAGCILDIEGQRVVAMGGQPETSTRGRHPSRRYGKDDLQSMALAPGMVWSEGYLGTNAVGLALMTAMPVQIVGAEHYYEVLHHLATAAAPVHDPNGRIVGTIGIVEPVTATDRHSLSLVMAAARAITNQLQANLYLEEANHRLAEVNTILEAISEGIIAWTEAGYIQHVNLQAAKMLSLSPTAVTGHPLSDVLDLPARLSEAVAGRNELRDVEVSFTVAKTPVRCLVSLHTVPASLHNSASYILTLRPIEQVRQLVHQQVGTQASVGLEDIPTLSAPMRMALRQARTAARGTAAVLLRGEGGVGKNHMARAIHNDGARTDRPFIAVNCRAIPHELMIGELLGHEEGEAGAGRPSKFELANRGTLLLDQVESLSLEMQSALLHLIETKHVMRLGGMHPIPVDVRIMATTSADLEHLVAQGQFISHLYYRFGVFNFVIPPLRERVDDIPLLAERFLSRFTTRNEQDTWIEREAMDVLCRYPWPGNVRELESVLERSLNNCYNNVITVSDLPEAIRRGRVVSDKLPQAQPVLTAAEAEREAILRAGWACNGRVTQMAQQLGIGRTTLWRKMKRFNISPEYFKR